MIELIFDRKTLSSDVKIKCKIKEIFQIMDSEKTIMNPAHEVKFCGIGFKLGFQKLDNNSVKLRILTSLGGYKIDRESKHSKKYFLFKLLLIKFSLLNENNFTSIFLTHLFEDFDYLAILNPLNQTEEQITKELNLYLLKLASSRVKNESSLKLNITKFNQINMRFTHTGKNDLVLFNFHQTELENSGLRTLQNNKNTEIFHLSGQRFKNKTIRINHLKHIGQDNACYILKNKPKKKNISADNTTLLVFKKGKYFGQTFLHYHYSNPNWKICGLDLKFGLFGFIKSPEKRTTTKYDFRNPFTLGIHPYTRTNNYISLNHSPNEKNINFIN